MNVAQKFASEWKRKEPKQKAYMGLGGLFLIFAIVGVFVPLVPQVPFAIIAALFFSKGSARIHRWIRHNKFFGQPVRDWEDHKVVRTKLKIISTTMMVAGAVIGHLKLEEPWFWVMDGLFLVSIIFVLTRKSETWIQKVTAKVAKS